MQMSESKDYYKTLGVQKNASEEDIKKAYRQKALKYHPDRCKEPNAQQRFQEIGEAFETLSDPEKRRIYDQVGSGGNFQSPFGGGGGGGGGASGPTNVHFSHMDANDIFRNFFGNSDPFGGDDSDAFGGGGGGGGMGGGGFPFGMAFGGGGMGGMPMGGFGGAQAFSGMGGNGGRSPSAFTQASASPQKAASVNHVLSCSLEDLYTGTKKKMRITKKVTEGNGRQISISSDKEITIKQGWKDGTKITFESEGDQAPGIIPADIIFTLQTKPHSRFRREGDDLLFTCPLTLAEAIGGFSKTVQSLDDRTITIAATSATPSSQQIITGEGMPNLKRKSKGDLRVSFNIEFPNLSSAQRAEICSILTSS